MLDLTDIIERALSCAQASRFDEMHDLCFEATDRACGDFDTWLRIGVIYSTFGFTTEARKCFVTAHHIDPKQLAPILNLSNLARDEGDHRESQKIGHSLMEANPNNPTFRRNFLLGLEYNPAVSSIEKLAQAKRWGNWAVEMAGGFRPRPAVGPWAHRPLRIGYVSSDLCQHTVGLFIKDILAAHNSANVTVFTYNAGKVDDWVTRRIRRSSKYVDVSRINDSELAEHIRKDKIDVLVDLAGHTAGSRLTVFAHRPAPVMVSWLGYFASTGLQYMDGVILDKWHVPKGFEGQFSEPILRLDGGRFCYQPVPFAPEVLPPPCIVNHHITFGSFNNTAKLNRGVLDLWSRVLTSIPESRLVLKWRTFNDQNFRRKIAQEFIERGVASHRVELRGPSFHVDLLKEYGDIDIGLDPFPFSGGLTSCEALWMGVPIITWPQGRVVSRQTFAFLSAIGLPEFSASSADEYIHIACSLARNKRLLAALRFDLREMMKVSCLMDVHSFTRGLENTYFDLYEKIVDENGGI